MATRYEIGTYTRGTDGEGYRLKAEEKTAKDAFKQTLIASMRAERGQVARVTCCDAAARSELETVIRAAAKRLQEDDFEMTPDEFIAAFVR